MMQRALVLIGVSKTGGGMPELESIGASFRDMKAWATEQGFQTIREHSDLDGEPVRLGDIVDTIEGLDGAQVPPEQLVVYFNGHGIRSNSVGDVWLLSKAPQQSGEAVNVYASVLAAYHGSFKHVVLITDACRVPPETGQFTGVIGTSIFVNKNFDGPSNLVDQFFASSVGTPSLEVPVGGEPCSIYTLQLSELLRGADPTILERMKAPNALPKVLRPLALKTALSTTVRARLKRNNISENMRPDAILTSDPTVWLSTFDRDPPPKTIEVQPIVAQLKTVPIVNFGQDTKSIGDTSEEEPKVVASVGEGFEPEEIESYSSSELTQINLEAALSPVTRTNTQRTTWIPEDAHFETSCGVWVDGEELKQVVCNNQVYSYSGRDQHVALDKPGLALITFTNDTGLLLPMYPGHIAFVKVDEGRVQTIAYEPSANYGPGYEKQEQRRLQFDQKSQGVRSLRDALGLAASTGDLRMAVLSMEQIARAVEIARYSKDNVDPMLMALLGYACAASGKQGVLPDLIEVCLTVEDFVPYDLVLLASIGRKVRDEWAEKAMPPFPLIAQGWPLLSSSTMEISDRVATVRDGLEESSWTMLSPAGIETCRAFMEESDRGEVMMMTN